MPAQGHKLPGQVTPWVTTGLPHRKSVSARPSPDAPRSLHLVELWPNAKGLSSLVQVPAATQQAWLEGLARLQVPYYNSWCVQAPGRSRGMQTSLSSTLIT